MTTAPPREWLATRYRQVRDTTEDLSAPLSPEDQTIQSMPEVSPTKWHRAHTSWFFEEFLLEPTLSGYSAFHPAYGYLFNSYYEAAGPRHPRPDRGLLSRPSAGEIGRYRQHVDEAMDQLLSSPMEPSARELVELGIHHEQQHQELLLMDIKHVLACNPLLPAYALGTFIDAPASPPFDWIEHSGGLAEIGHAGDGFAFDNESPRHIVHLQPFALASRPVTCGEWLVFIDDGGYRRPELWLSDGWAMTQAQGWGAPLYWSRSGDGWHIFTLGGNKPINEAEPVCHVSYFEADAFARWAGARLPTEAEWEAAAQAEWEVTAEVSTSTSIGDRTPVHPRPVGETAGLFGDVWQWTSSAYSPYPGFRPPTGAVGEYNGKFMVNQYVLRGGCCATPEGHVRSSYRNFFPASARWAFSGLRLAKEL